MAKIKGMGQVMTMVKNLRRDTDKAMRRGILEGAKLIEADARSRVPVDKGLLLASIGVEQTSGPTYIYAAARYAPYQEFGTGPMTKAPPGFEKYAAEFIISGKGHTKPQAFLFPAYFKYKEQVVTLVETEIQTMLDKNK